jgi:hypothetical protein
MQYFREVQNKKEGRAGDRYENITSVASVVKKKNNFLVQRNRWGWMIDNGTDYVAIILSPYSP